VSESLTRVRKREGKVTVLGTLYINRPGSVRVYLCDPIAFDPIAVATRGLQFERYDDVVAAARAGWVPDENAVEAPAPPPNPVFDSQARIFDFQGLA
jgi:hypothetical protein